MSFSQYLPRELPEPVQDLAALALDLRWSWHHGTDELWQHIDAELWKTTANPWLIMESVSDQRLLELAQDPDFLKILQAQVEAREAHFNADAWFPAQYGNRFKDHIAYFSMEFGISESLPIYSGGLGVLAGDHLKTACDLNVPLVGIGLLYQQGYFRQVMDAQGRQLEFYPFNDPTMLPVVPLRDKNGEWINVTIPLPGRVLRLRTWHARIGRRSLFLLDSNDLLNDPGDRGITSELYGGGPEMRLQQEMVLGIGGWRLLERLGLDCAVCHLNEGHAALAILERARTFAKRHGVSFGVALRATRAGNLFTTHTPVEAGFDRFQSDLFSHYFDEYAKDLDIDPADILALGRANAEDPAEPFNMAYLAVRGSAAVNGVSRLHGEVSRSIFQPLFPRWPGCQVPIGHVTNGVHVPSWDSAAADSLWTEACGKSRWMGELEKMESEFRCLPEENLWLLRTRGRRQLIEFLRQRLVRHHEKGELDPDTLTLGFARRFAEYKRTNLLLRDPYRLMHLLSDRSRPVQLVFAGKAHPRDEEGKESLREWQQFIAENGMHDRAVFVEDYDLRVAERLVQGVDVWINTPRRPWEASGTSGMKVLVNGGINLSELDGWWAEAYAPDVGWALGDGKEHLADWDREEALQLYAILENEVIPRFYKRDEAGLPREWINLVRESMAKLTAQYSTNRMLREYVENYYLPLGDAFLRRSRGLAQEIEEWHENLSRHWDRIRFGNVACEKENDAFHWEVQVYLDDLPHDAVSVELYAEDNGKPTVLPMKRGMLLSGASNAYAYKTSVKTGRPASDFTPRIVPAHREAKVPLEANFILWYR